MTRLVYECLIQSKPAPATEKPLAATPQQLLQELQSVLRKCIPALVNLHADSAIAGTRAFCLAAFEDLAASVQGSAPAGPCGHTQN